MGQKESPKWPRTIRIAAWPPLARAFRAPQPGGLRTTTASALWVSSPSIPSLVAWGTFKTNSVVSLCQVRLSFARSNRIRFSPPSSARLRRTPLLPPGNKGTDNSNGKSDRAHENGDDEEHRLIQVRAVHQRHEHERIDGVVQ